MGFIFLRINGNLTFIKKKIFLLQRVWTWFCFHYRSDLASSAAGAAAGGRAGAATAANLDLYNRQLHQKEAELLERLTQNLDPKTVYRLKAAACALVQCAATVSKDDPLYERLTTLQADGTPLKREQALIKSLNPALFTYTDWNKWNDRRIYFDKWVTRAKGIADLGAGSLAAAGSAVLATGACGGTLGLACPVAGSLGALGVSAGLNQAKEGARHIFKAYESKEGKEVQASFRAYYGPVPKPEPTAPLVQDAIDLGPILLEATAVTGILQVVKGVKAVQRPKYVDKTEVQLGETAAKTQGAVKEGTKGINTVIEPKIAQQFRSLDNIGSLQGAKLSEVEKLADEKLLASGWAKIPLKDGNGVRYFDGKGNSFQINK